ncbi:hypothetical protein CTI12_AA465620 [Artemisia annua]|uniref:SWEET sugar transporter n=1 Tax=Artemisia annua TaxID=35608 RepID=A0A2U1LQG9_ARTAN|nr:hypothetical protein CTI12_AA465620 [Artemisia annua]
MTICLMMVGVVVTSLLTWILSEGWRRAAIVGVMCNVVSLCLLTPQLTDVVQAVRTNSSESLDFTISFWLTLSSSMMWLLYGLFDSDLSILAHPPDIVPSCGVVYWVCSMGERDKDYTITDKSTMKSPYRNHVMLLRVRQNELVSDRDSELLVLTT